MMVRHIRLDRRLFYLFEGLGINSLCRTTTGDSTLIEIQGYVEYHKYYYNGLTRRRHFFH
jgi:hypothetical protein